MKKHGILVLGGLVVVALASVMFAYRTNYNEWTIVKTLGKPGEPVDGRKAAGLRARAPFPLQEVVRYDARLRLLVDELTQISVQGSGSITVTAHCTWRIADPVRFLDAVSTEEAGERELRKLLAQNVRQVISSGGLDQLISTGADPERQPRLEGAILAGLRDKAAREYGIDVTTVGLEALGVPQDTSQKIIENQKKDREKIAETIRNAGNNARVGIIGRAKQDAEVVLAFAEGRAQKIRTRGIERAAMQYKQFEEFPELAVFLRKLKMIEKAFSENAVIYVDAALIDAVKLLYEKLSVPDKAASRPADPGRQ